MLLLSWAGDWAAASRPGRVRSAVELARTAARGKATGAHAAVVKPGELMGTFLGSISWGVGQRRANEVPQDTCDIEGSVSSGAHAAGERAWSRAILRRPRAVSRDSQYVARYRGLTP